MTKEKYTRGKEAKFAFLVGPYVHKDAQWGRSLYEEVCILISKQVLTIRFVGLFDVNVVLFCEVKIF